MKTSNILLFTAIFSGWLLPVVLQAQIRDIPLTIHLRGVSESKISLLALSGSKAFKPIIEVPVVKNGGTTTLTVSKEYLPGEFVLRFDYKEKETSTPYPSEKNIFIGTQNLELWVSPLYCNNADSTWFQPGETENATFLDFSKENGKQKEKIGLLQNFLMNYDDTDSKLYKLGIEEYEKRRTTYNEWIDERVKKDKALFVSTLYRFQFVPQIPWNGSESDRMISVINHYFDGMDFGDSLIIKTSELNQWMNSYVNLHGQMATSVALRDSLIPAAAHNAIEKAKLGHPMVYGWMVDYFYRGFEANAIPAGMKVLEPYINDPNCLTSKKIEIERRLKGMQTLVVGTKAPEIEMKDKDGTPFELSTLKTNCNYVLLVFWSADCSHCVETVDKIYPMLQQPEMQVKVKVVAISLDETETEIAAWNKKVGSLAAWTHLRADEGVRSKVANDYFILATPVMILLDAKTRSIVSSPNTVDELTEVLK